MKKNFFLKNLEKLKIEKGKWVNLTELDRIELNSGRVIPISWEHMRFCFLDDQVLIRYGNSIPYGGRLPLNFDVSPNKKSVRFFTNNLKEDSPFYSKDDLPNIHTGTFIILSNSVDEILCQTTVINVIYEGTTIRLDFSLPLVGYTKQSKLSYYDSQAYEDKNDSCIHGTMFEGIYMKFIPKKAKHKNKKVGFFHEAIKYKNISSFFLKLKNNKTFEISEEEKEHKYDTRTI